MFGKQLIDTFKPSSIIVEDGPLQEIKQPKSKCPESGIINPETYTLTDELNGDILDKFIKFHIEDNQNAYSIDTRQGLVLKSFEDGIQQHTDMPSYAMHHVRKLRETNSVNEDTKLVFCDLSQEEIASSFIQYTSP